MIYLIGVNHYVQYVRGPLGESFAEFLLHQIKAWRIAFVAEVSTNANPPEQQESNASTVTKLLKIEYRVCDAIHKEGDLTHGVGGAKADSFLMEQYWLSKIQDKTSLNVLFICQADHVESFSSILSSKNHNVQIISKDWLTEEDLRRKVYAGVALPYLEVRQLLTLTDFIAGNAVALNREFGNLFGYLQRSLNLQIFTVVNQLYEKHNPAAHSLLSIPIIISTLKENSGKVKIRNRSTVQDRLSTIAYSRTLLNQLSDEKLVSEVADYLNQRLEKLSEPLARARNEREYLLGQRTKERDIQHEQWDSVNELIEFASLFFELTGEGILGLSGQLDVSETLDQSLRRLLKAAKIEMD
jgi:hypothetical protein